MLFLCILWIETATAMNLTASTAVVPAEEIADIALQFVESNVKKLVNIALDKHNNNKKKRIQQHDNETRRLFRNEEPFDSYAQHFYKQFDHEPMPKQLQKLQNMKQFGRGILLVL